MRKRSIASSVTLIAVSHPMVMSVPKRSLSIVEAMRLADVFRLPFAEARFDVVLFHQVLHYLDDLDSKMEAMRAHFERESSLDGPWTSYNASLGRPLLNTEKFLAPKNPPRAEDPAGETPTAEDESLEENSKQVSTLPAIESKQ